jgi:hypothetical protein
VGAVPWAICGPLRVCLSPSPDNRSSITAALPSVSALAWEAAGLAGAATGGSCAVRHSAELLTWDGHQQIPLRAGRRDDLLAPRAQLP